MSVPADTIDDAWESVGKVGVGDPATLARLRELELDRPRYRDSAQARALALLSNRAQ